MKQTLLVGIAILSSIINAQAYTTSWTPFTDQTYAPQTQIKDGGLIKNHLETDFDIGTLTVRFDPDEIGRDEKAAAMVAKKEALALGGNVIYAVSATQYNSTENISSLTIRVSYRQEKK